MPKIGPKPNPGVRRIGGVRSDRPAMKGWVKKGPPESMPIPKPKDDEEVTTKPKKRKRARKYKKENNDG